MRLKDLFPSDLPTGNKKPGMARGEEDEREDVEEGDEPEREEEGEAEEGEGEEAGEETERPAAPGGEGPPEQEATAGASNTNPTKEEAEAYKRTMLAAGEVIYNEKTNGDVMSMMEQLADDPPTALAETARVIIRQLDEQSGGQLPETIILPAAAEIAEMLAEMAQKAGLFEVDQDVLQAAGQSVMWLVGGDYGVSQQDIEQMLAALSQEELQQIGQEQTQVAQRAASRGAARPPMQQGVPPNGQPGR